MKFKVRKLFMDFEREEKWINEMAEKGFNLAAYHFSTYTFEEGKPGGYLYRLELLENPPTHVESRAYIKFMEENGVELVDTYSRWVFFRKKAADGPFDIYTDYASRINHYKRILTLLGAVLILNLGAALGNIAIGIALGISRGIYFNIYVSLFSWGIAAVLGMGFIKYLRKINKMKKDKQIFE